MKLSLVFPSSLKDLASESFERLEKELEKNERLIWLFGLGIAVLYMSFVLYLADQSDQAERRYISTQARLTQLQTQTSGEDWAKKAADAVAYNNTLTERFWPGDTPGLAEAGFERWIRQTMDGYGIAVRQVQLTRGSVLEDEVGFETTALSSVERLRAKVIGPLNEPALIRFINDAAFHDSWVVVEQFVARGGRSDRFEIDITTYYNNSTRLAP